MLPLWYPHFEHKVFWWRTRGVYVFANYGVIVVDYIITSSGLFDHVSNFQVIDNDEYDHFPLTCLLSLPCRGLPVNAHVSNDVTPHYYMKSFVGKKSSNEFCMSSWPSPSWETHSDFVWNKGQYWYCTVNIKVGL